MQILFSYNSIETLKGLEQFGRLEELILDNNKLGDGVTFPYLPYLKTLSLNNNQVSLILISFRRSNNCLSNLRLRKTDFDLGVD